MKKKDLFKLLENFPDDTQIHIEILSKQAIEEDKGLSIYDIHTQVDIIDNDDGSIEFITLMNVLNNPLFD